jgi:hypothetical protein
MSKAGVRSYTIDWTSNPSRLSRLTSLVDKHTMPYRTNNTETAPLRTIYLDCPFVERGLAKARGAQWDEGEKQWWVPPHLYPQLEEFNAWRPDGKVYLVCSFDQNDQVKQAGAKWDRQVKRWYVAVQRMAAVPAKFSPWLLSSTAAAALPKNLKSPLPKTSKRGHASDAAILRVNENMTVDQLREECRVRHMKGFSGQSKGWLLEQLGVGTVWLAASHTGASNSKAVPEKSVKPVAAKSTKNAAAKDKKVEAKPSKKVTAKQDVKEAVEKVKKKTATKSVAPPNYSLLPRVSSSLTIVQLSYELFHRHPHIKGVSGKPKTWFLGELGDGSIWTTSSDISSHILSDSPRVSKGMTVAQLQHELLARSPSVKGISSKSKDELVKLAGVGSIWTTGTLMKQAPLKKNTIANAKNESGAITSHMPKAGAFNKKPPPVAAKRKADALTTAKKEATPKAATKTRKEPAVPKKTAKSKPAPDKVQSHFPSWFNQTVGYDTNNGFLVPTPVCSSSSMAVASSSVKPPALSARRPAHQTIKAEKKVKIESTPPVPLHLTAAHLQAASRYLPYGGLGGVGAPATDWFRKIVRDPPAKHFNEQYKLPYTVWQSCGYIEDNFHTYYGEPDKDFNSSYATLEEANERAEFVFYYQAHLALGGDADELPYAETDEVTSHGFRLLECVSDGGERWTVSVVPSNAFDFIDL